MSWKPFVVGVDLSPEARDAAVFAVAAAQRAATSCHLVHATSGSARPSRRGGYPYTRLYEEARLRVVAALGNRVPTAVLDSLTVRRGKPGAVLNGVVAAVGAELVVLGGKHHSALGRWLGGSTSVEVARTAGVPVLVTVGAPVIRRVLVAVDSSAAARPTLAVAERYAALFGAELRALSVVEELPALAVVPQPETSHYYREWEQTLAHEIWPLIRTPGVESIVRYGSAADTIQREAAEWRADLVVVGSHGKRSIERMLGGSVSEGLINHLPASLLVVPTRQAAVVDHEEET